MRNALVIVVAAVVVFLAGWLIDDKLFGDDIPRNRSVAGVDIGRMSVADAEVRLGAARLDGQVIELRHGSDTLITTASELGIELATAQALVAAAERPSLWKQPFNWTASLFRGRDHPAATELAIDDLADALAFLQVDSFFNLDLGRPQIELIDGEFVEVDTVEKPVIDLEELRVRVFEASAKRSDEAIVIEVPIGGTSTVDRGAGDLIAQASRMTADGIQVVITGSFRRRLIPESALRSWIVFGGTIDEPTIGLDAELAQSTLETLFIDEAVEGTEATFWVDSNDQVHIRGNVPGSVCCSLDAADRIFAAMQRGDAEVELSPREDPDTRGVAWAESMKITELVGEFTTNYVPNQSRVLNIMRIAELTQGVVIEPGETFSVNEYVGVRTRANGFVDAGVIVNGVFQTSVGGGISQYATTLFNAAFFAGLDFGEYQSHSIYISRYPYGREATVSYPHPDLQIINNTPYGVLLWPTTTHDSITVKLFSTRWVEGEQTGQREWREGSTCTRVQTERTRVWLDGSVEVDTVTARYRPEGLRCDGSPSNPDPTTTTTAPPTTSVPPSTSVP